MVRFGGDVATAESASSPRWRRWEPRGLRCAALHAGGLRSASWGSVAAFCLPRGQGVGQAGGGVKSESDHHILQFHFPVPAQFLAGLSGAPGLQGQPRAAAVEFLQGEMCRMGGKSCWDCVLTAGLQEPNSLQYTGNCSCEICCPAQGCRVWTGRGIA